MVPEFKLLALEKMRIRDDPGPGRLQFQLALPVAVERRLGCVLGVYSLEGAKRAIAMALQAHDSATVMLHAQLLRVRAG